MKHIPLFGVLLLSLSIHSCGESTSSDDAKCGEEAVAGMYLRTPAQFANYVMGSGSENASYRMSYTTSRGEAIFIQSLTIDKSCASSNPLISLTLELKSRDSLIQDSALVVDGAKTVLLPIIKSGSVFFEDHEYPFDDPKGSGKLLVSHKCSFPTQGSWSADSAYLFSRLVVMSTGVGYKRVKE